MEGIARKDIRIYTDTVVYILRNKRKITVKPIFLQVITVS